MLFFGMAYFGGRWAFVWGLVAALVFVTGTASAADDRDEVVSLTFSPLHLILPMVEVQGEYKVIDHLGVSLIAGYGWPTEEVTDANGDRIDAHFDLLEVGTQVMWYPLRRFRSLELGVEATYVNVSTNEPVGDTNATAVGGGFALGPLVGFKFIVGPGFTGFAQLGFAYYAIHAEANDNTGAHEEADQSDFILNLNLNLGWSF
jgi:hypothetical protein